MSCVFSMLKKGKNIVMSRQRVHGIAQSQGICEFLQHEQLQLLIIIMRQ